MAIRLPKPKNASSLPQSQPLNSENNGVVEVTQSESSITTLPLSKLNQGYNHSRFFDWQGRVNRIQYLTYSIFNALLALLMLAAMFVVLGGFQGIIEARRDQLPISILGVISVAATVLFYLQLAITKRRFNDFNKTGWLALTMIVPIINIVTYLYLLMVESDEGANYYGLPARPSPNLRTILVVLIPMLVISLIALLTQVVVPSYQQLLNTNGNQPKAAESPSKNTPVTNSQAIPAQTLGASSVQAENLRTEAVVITGEQLGNGVASTTQPSNQPVPNQSLAQNATVSTTADNVVNNASSVNAGTSSQSNEVAVANTTTAISTQESSNTDVNATSNLNTTDTRSISYEDFVKASEQQVFIDNTKAIK